MQAVQKNEDLPGASIFSLTERVLRLGVGIEKLREDFSEMFTGGRTVPYKAVQSLPLLQRVKVGVQGETVRLPHEGPGVLFLTTLTGEGGFIGPHKHRDCTEVVHVIKGTVREAESGVCLREGDTHRVGLGEIHYYISKSPEAVLLVEIRSTRLLPNLKAFARLGMLAFGGSRVIKRVKGAAAH